MQLNRNRNGFTIVELLIVIVVIAILAAITIVAYNGIQQRAGNAQTQQGIATYAKSMSVYAVTNGVYPGAGTYRCVKDDKDSNSCSQVGTGASTCFGLGGAPRNSSFETTLMTVVSSIPTVSSQSMLCGGQPYRGSIVGTNADGKGGQFSVYYKGNVLCPIVGGVTNDIRSQQDDVTYCQYQLPVL